MKELEEKYLWVTNETIRALQAVLASTSMGPDEDLDHYIMQATRLRSRLAWSMSLSPIVISPTSQIKGSRRATTTSS